MASLNKRGFPEDRHLTHNSRMPGMTFQCMVLLINKNKGAAILPEPISLRAEGPGRGEGEQE